MKKFLIAFMCACFILFSGFSAWAGTTLKPLLKQISPAAVPSKKTSTALPELYIESIKASPNVVQGKKLTLFSVAVKNDGNTVCRGNKKGAEKGYTLDVNLSGKELLRITDTPDILPGKTKIFDLNDRIAIPSATTPGSYDLLVTVDPANSIQEIRENNNTKIVKIAVQSSLMPDLVVSAEGSSEAKTGTNIPAFNINVQNRGNAVAKGVNGNQDDGYYVSIQLVPAGSPQNIQVLRVLTQTSDLAPGQSINMPVNNFLTIPAGKAPGNYQIRVVADSNKRVEESNEANNTFLHNISITDDPPAELGISIQTLTTVVEPGKKIPACSVAVSNTGGKTAAGVNYGFSIVLLLSSKNTPPQVIPDQINSSSYSDGMALNIIHKPEDLQPGQTRTYPLNNTLTIPADTPVGQYHIIAVADPKNRVAEQNENNNISAVPVSVRIPDKPDLSVTRFISTEGANLEITIRNNGPGTIPDSYYNSNAISGYQIYKDNMDAGGGSLIFLDPNRVLKNPGGTIETTFGVLINCTESPGSHVIRIKVDPLNQVDESNENNNEMVINKNCP